MPHIYSRTHACVRSCTSLVVWYAFFAGLADKVHKNDSLCNQNAICAPKALLAACNCNTKHYTVASAYSTQNANVRLLPDFYHYYFFQSIWYWVQFLLISTDLFWDDSVGPCSDLAASPGAAVQCSLIILIVFNFFFNQFNSVSYFKYLFKKSIIIDRLIVIRTSWFA